jgi:hypothetical protein
MLPGLRYDGEAHPPVTLQLHVALVFTGTRTGASRLQASEL